jgi:hypothetical protein
MELHYNRTVSPGAHYDWVNFGSMTGYCYIECTVWQRRRESALLRIGDIQEFPRRRYNIIVMVCYNERDGEAQNALSLAAEKDGRKGGPSYNVAQR